MVSELKPHNIGLRSIRTFGDAIWTAATGDDRRGFNPLL
jgi:hypothetical protein